MTNFMQIARGVRLSSGKHDGPGPAMCFNEMVAWFNGEAHTDRPLCACPVISEFALRLNDWLPDAQRQQLLPYIPRVVGTRSPEHEVPRLLYIMHYVVAVVMPAVFHGDKREVAELQAFPVFTLAPIQGKTVSYMRNVLHTLAAHASRAARAALDASAALGTFDAKRWDVSHVESIVRVTDAALNAFEAAGTPRGTHDAYYGLRILDGVLAIGPSNELGVIPEAKMSPAKTLRMVAA